MNLNKTRVVPRTELIPGLITIKIVFTQDSFQIRNCAMRKGLIHFVFFAWFDAHSILFLDAFCQK